jgi:hypothetical protein
MIPENAAGDIFQAEKLAGTAVMKASKMIFHRNLYAWRGASA